VETTTENWVIEFENPSNNDNEPRTRISAGLKDEDTEPARYDAEKKISSRSVSTFAKTTCRVLGQPENGDLKEELETAILGKKAEIREEAEALAQQKDFNGDEERLKEILTVIKEHGDTEGMLPAEELEREYPRARQVIRNAEEDYAFVTQDQNIQLLDKGRELVQETIGMEAFDGDPMAEAVNQLEEDPLSYYLDSFSKVHIGDELLKIWELSSALSSVCSDRQIHSWAVGPSGKGKSHIKRRICDFYLPEIAYQQITGISPKALLYKCNEEGRDFLNEQVVFFDEVEDLEEVVTLLRSITDQDEDEINYTTVKDQETETIEMRVDSITVWFTSVETFQDEQLKNRFILTNPDGSKDLDQKVFDWMQERLHKGGSLDKPPKESPVIQRMVMNIRENTPEYKPVVPFRINWKQKFNRRLYPYFFTLMGLMAKIHYKNREKVDGHIIVTEADFKLASLIWSRLIDTTVAQVDEAGIRLLQELPETEASALTRRELQRRLQGFSTRKVSDKCESLEETEELQLINTKYVDNNYKHWAGRDVDKLTDNRPEIKDLSRDVVEDILGKAGIDTTDAVYGSITQDTPDVYDKLTTLDEEDDEELELGDEEERLIKVLKEYEWGMDLNGVEAMEGMEAIRIGEKLEERGVVRIDGENFAQPTSKLGRIEEENPI
jgi:hypothetical protein